MRSNSVVFTITGTGHRPQKLGGFDFYTSKGLNRLQALAAAVLTRYQPERVISGMVLGWDTGLALAALTLKIPLIAAVPFAGQEREWTNEQQKIYRSILDQAEEVVVVNQGTYSPLFMQFRNEWMVDWADLVLALWDGSKGGTYNTIKYAKMKQKPVVNLWSSWTKYSGI